MKIDCSLNITKRREQVFYGSSLSTDTVGIAFTSSDPLTSDNNISIIDRSTSLTGNRVQEIDYTVIDGFDAFNIATDLFVVTDIFVTEDNTITPEPLFYQHTISLEYLPRTDSDSYDFSLQAGYRLINAEILDSFFQSIRLTEKYLDSSTGILYSNLQTEFNSTVDYTIYYVKYTFTNGTEVKTLIELLDNKPIYRLATYEDLDGLLQIIGDGRKVYLLEDEGEYFHVTLPSAGSYAFKPLSKARIKILSPPSSTSEDSWFVRISNGKFFQNINGSLYKYYIAEFLTQSFTPVAPIKNVQSEDSTILSKKLIKLDRENIYQDVDFELYVDIQISKSDGTGVAAFTTNPGIVGDIADNGIAFKQWSLVNRTGIRSIDASIGIVDIEGLELKSSWIVTSDYSFEETNYEFTLFDLNPISNSEALTHKLVLFIDPESGTTKDSTLYYLKVDNSGKVTESNWAEFDNDTELYSDATPLYYESYPDYLTPTSHHNFVDEFSVEASTPNLINFLILGDLSAAEAQHVNELTKIDTRVRGGGIVASGLQDYLNSDATAETQWFWDVGYWDGIPYPGNASYLVEVPVDILDGIDQGIFTQAQVRDIVSRHTAAGVYPVIKAYGVENQITNITPVLSGLILNWYSDGFGY